MWKRLDRLLITSLLAGHVFSVVTLGYVALTNRTLVREHEGVKLLLQCFAFIAVPIIVSWCAVHVRTDPARTRFALWVLCVTTFLYTLAPCWLWG